MSWLPGSCPLATWNHRRTTKPMVTVVASETACAIPIEFETGGRILSEAQEDVAMRNAEAVDGM